MSLPDYFLADLEDRSLLTPVMVTDACLAVRANRRRYLDERRTPDLIEAIAAVAEDWLDPNNPFRRCALERGPAPGSCRRRTVSRSAMAGWGCCGFWTWRTCVR